MLMTRSGLTLLIARPSRRRCRHRPARCRSASCTLGLDLLAAFETARGEMDLLEDIAVHRALLGDDGTCSTSPDNEYAVQSDDPLTMIGASDGLDRTRSRSKGQLVRSTEREAATYGRTPVNSTVVSVDQGSESQFFRRARAAPAGFVKKASFREAAAGRR